MTRSAPRPARPRSAHTAAAGQPNAGAGGSVHRRMCRGPWRGMPNLVRGLVLSYLLAKGCQRSGVWGGRFTPSIRYNRRPRTLLFAGTPV